MSDFLATTTTGDLTNGVKSYYDKVLLDAIDSTVRAYQFAEKKPVPKSEGTSIKWNIAKKFDLGRVLTEGQAFTISAGRNLSTLGVSAIIQQYGRQIIAVLKSFLKNMETLACIA